MPASSSTCPECGAPVPANQIGGLCPRCLVLGLGCLSGSDDPSSTATGETSSYAERASHLELLRVLGQGGMGVVLEAKDRTVGRTVAVKRLRPELQNRPQAVARFTAELQIAGQLEHPGIVPLYEAGTDAQGNVYYAMRRIQGTTLADILEQIKRGDRATVLKYPLAALLTVFQKACDAMAYAHSRKVIHRDLKPENIMVGEFGEVLVMDWGLAKVLGKEERESAEAEPGLSLPDGTSNPQSAIRNLKSDRSVSAESLHTMEGTVLGTPGAMAPEQAAGQTAVADVRTDVFGLGGVLYRILTLRPPAGGSTVQEVLRNTQRGYIPPPVYYNQPREIEADGTRAKLVQLAHVPGGRVPAALSAVAMKALAVQPEDRYQTVPELQKEIAAYQTGFATMAEEAGVWTLISLAVKRRKREFAWGAAAMILVLGTIAAFFGKVTYTLSELRSTAPTFHRQALASVEELNFEEALRLVSYALRLQSDDADWHALQGNVLQSLLRLDEARTSYQLALRRDPNHALARQNFELTGKLIAARAGGTNIPTSVLEELSAAMLVQGRSAERIALAKRIGMQRQADQDALKSRCEASGWQVELTVDEGRQLHLGVRFEGITDLSPLRDAPLTSLHVFHADKLTDLSPLRGLLLKQLTLSDVHVLTDLRPLQGMPLESLSIDGNSACPLSDLTPLKRMPLRSLNLMGCTNLSDLRPLKGAPLSELSVFQSSVSDLNPLKGMALTWLDLHGCGALGDLAALRGMPLTWLRCSYTQVHDISPLQGMPLKVLTLNNTQVTNIAALAGMPLVQLDLGQTPNVDFAPLAGLKLVELRAGWTKLADTRLLEDMALTNLDLAYTPVADLAPLAGMRFNSLVLQGTKIRDLMPLRGMPLRILDAGLTAVNDLSPLRDMSVTELYLQKTSVKDLSFLRHMALTRLDLSQTEVTDLSALAGAPVEWLHLAGTEAGDLAVLRGMPLKELNLETCYRIRDLTPLAECRQLERLCLPPRAAGVEALRGLPNLQFLTYTIANEGWKQTASEFWREHDARRDSQK